MADVIPIRRALVSVSDKDGLIPLARDRSQQRLGKDRLTIVFSPLTQSTTRP